MRVQSLLLAGATAATAAQTVTLFLPGFDSQDIHGKVLGSRGSTTTYLLNCPPDAASDECGIPPQGITAIQGVSTATIAYDFGRMTARESCSYDSSMAYCAISVDEDGLTTSFTSAIPFSEIPGRALMPVTVTATQTGGAPATTGGFVAVSTATQTGTFTTSASTASVTGTGTETAATATGTDSSAAATSQTETGNAAMPMVTGNARWAAGGVAAAIALVAL